MAEPKGEPKGDFDEKSEVFAPVADIVACDKRDADSVVLRQTIEHFTDDWLRVNWEENADMLELFEWECQHWHLFDPDLDEHALEHKQLHEQYARDFEERLERFVQKQGLSVSDFYEVVREHMLDSDAKHAEDAKSAGAGPGAATGLGSKLLQVVNKATDYEAWASSMRQAVRDQRAMDEVD